MDSIKQLHTSVAQTFEDCFDNVYRSLNAELAAYDARVKDAEKRAQAADEARHKMASEADMLRHELSLLQKELRQNEINSKEGEIIEKSLRWEEMYHPHRVLGAVNPSDISAEGLKTISDKYIALYEDAGMLLESSEDLKRQVKRHKKKLEYFQKCLQRPEFHFMLDGNIVKFQLAEPTAENDQVPPVGSTPELVKPLEATDNDLDANISTGSPITSTSGVDQDQTGSSTEDESEYAIAKQPQGGHSELASTPSYASTDELPPIIPTAASTQESVTLKRKHSAPDQLAPKVNTSSERPKNGGPEHPILVKSETLSSSPLRTYSPHLGPPGTQDLDDIGDSVVTPTKKIRFHRCADFQAPLRNFGTAIGSPSARHMAHQNYIISWNKPTSRAPRVLQPVDSNLRAPSGPSQIPSSIRTKYLGSITRISSITEDGDENRPPAVLRGRGRKPPHHKPNARNPSSERRLLNLLDGPSPSSRLLQARETSNAPVAIQDRTRRSSRKGGFLTCHGETDTTTSTITLATSESSQRNPKSSVRGINVDTLLHQPENLSQMEIEPDDEPYRALPIHRLGLDHFKINPDYNHGLDFAYDEVVRRRDDRKCISGCTRLGCCGDKFLAMARFGIPADVSGKAKGDQELLEEYVGADKHTIDQRSSVERQTLLDEARARSLSNRFGRHRHQHHRSGTPPGFWRTDMPGTQELEEDREEAQRMEREKVKERYREAMRPGGRWIFADE